MENARKWLGMLILFSIIPFFRSEQVSGITPDDKDDNDRPNATPPKCISKHPVDDELLLQVQLAAVMRPDSFIIDMSPLESESEPEPSSSSEPEPSSSATTTATATDLGIRVEAESQIWWFGNHTGERIMGSYQKQELGKGLMFIVAPANLGVLGLQQTRPSSIMVSLVLISSIVGFTAIFYGLFVRGTLPRRFAIRFELFGMALVLFATFGIVAANLHPSVWIPFLCWLLTLLPFFLICKRSASRSSRPP